jgi:acetoin utilization protein AcuB
MTVDLRILRVRDWMLISPPVITPHTSIATALRLLREHGVSALPVWNEGRLVGMVDERDLLRMTPSQATTLDVYELREVLEKMTVARLTAPVDGLTPDSSLADAALLMLRSAKGTIPVVDDGRPVGLFTWAALLRAVAGNTVPAPPRALGLVSLELATRGAGSTGVEPAR